MESIKLPSAYLSVTESALSGLSRKINLFVLNVRYTPESGPSARNYIHVRVLELKLVSLAQQEESIYEADRVQVELTPFSCYFTLNIRRAAIVWSPPERATLPAPI